MFHMTLMLCDTFIVAKGHDTEGWTGTCTDLLTGKCKDFKWTFQQFADVIALALAGDNHWNTDLLYERVKHLFTDWETEVMPIP